MSSETVSAPSVLRRGTACQMCRKRKLKCTGERPNCALCLKNGQNCVYDAIQKPKSQIRKLEDKISQLETVLSQLAPDHGNHNQPSSSTADRRSSAAFPYAPSTQFKSESISEVSHPIRQAKRDEQRAFSKAFEELWATSSTFGIPNMNYSENQAPATAPEASDPAVEPNFFPMDMLNDYTGQTDEVMPMVDSWSFDFNNPLSCDNPIESFPPPETYSIDPSILASMHIDQDRLMSAGFSQPANTPSVSFSQAPLSLSPSATLLNDRVAALKSHVVAHGDLPEYVRDPLFEIFFSKMSLFRFDMNVDKFKRSLGESDPKKRPHPAFLLAMCHSASQFSSDEAVQALDNVFLQQAKKRLDEAVSGYDYRLIDMIRAAVVLSFSSYSRANYRPAWIFGGLALRICCILNLQRITYPFSVTSNQHPKLSTRSSDRVSYKTRNRRRPVAKDLAELGEFIQVFWIAWTIDRVGSTTSGFPPAMHWSEIETPFVSPLDRYADDNLINSQPKIALYDLFDDSQTTLKGDLSASCSHISSFFLNEASRLEDEFLQPSTRDSYIAFCMSNPPSSVTSPADSPAFNDTTVNASDNRVRKSSDPNLLESVPVEIVRLHDALVKFVRSLPAKHSNPAQIVLGGLSSWKPNQVLPGHSDSNDTQEQSNQVWGIDPETVLIHTEIHTAFALIHQERSDFVPSAWAQAVSSARSVVKILHMVAHVDFNKLGLTLVVCWKIVAHILLDEVKRQRSEGNEEEALHITIDVELIVLALKRFGDHFAAGTNLVKESQG